MSSHLARFTRRISSIFSSTEAWRASMRRSRSRVAQSTLSDWRTTCSGAGLDTVSTPYSVTLEQTSSYIAALTKSSTPRPVSLQMLVASRVPKSSGRGAFMSTRSYSVSSMRRRASLTLPAKSSGQ